MNFFLFHFACIFYGHVGKMRVDFYFQLSFYILDSQFCFDDSEKDYDVRCILVNDSLRDGNGTLGVNFFFFFLYLRVVILVILFFFF